MNSYCINRVTTSHLHNDFNDSLCVVNIDSGNHQLSILP